MYLREMNSVLYVLKSIKLLMLYTLALTIMKRLLLFLYLTSVFKTFEERTMGFISKISQSSFKSDISIVLVHSKAVSLLGFDEF